jgi:hypothetical protein
MKFPILKLPINEIINLIDDSTWTIWHIVLWIYHSFEYLRILVIKFINLLNYILLLNWHNILRLFIYIRYIYLNESIS